MIYLVDLLIYIFGLGVKVLYIFVNLVTLYTSFLSNGMLTFNILVLSNSKVDVVALCMCL